MLSNFYKNDSETGNENRSFHQNRKVNKDEDKNNKLRRRQLQSMKKQLSTKGLHVKAIQIDQLVG